jgi:glycerol-1-phosphate dehydrogenase [NAD(P)+]
MSHILDLLAETANAPLAQHGTQVSMAAIIGAALYRKFLATFDPAKVDIDACYPTAEAMHARIRAAFDQIDPTGKAGEECWSDYQLKLGAWHAHREDFEAFLANWAEIKPEIERFTAPPERLAEILRAIDAPVHFADLVPPATEKQVRFAFMNAPLMRKRLTIGDMLIFLNWNRDKLWDDLWAETQGI